MRLLYILNGLGFSSGMPIGGADKRALEVGRLLSQLRRVDVSFLTTTAGERVLRDNNWLPSFLINRQPGWWPVSWFKTLPGRALSYFYLIFFANKVDCDQFDIIYPTSDFFFDLWPAIKIKKRSGGCAKLVGIVHHLIPLPWRRSGSFLINLCLFLCQRSSFWLLSRFADLVLVADTGEGRKIAAVLEKCGLPKSQIGFFLNGVAYQEIERVLVGSPPYEACMVGGLRPSKGIFDLPEIWRLVSQTFPQARLLVIGGGTSENELLLWKKLKQAGVDGLVDLAGVVPQDQLYSKMKSSQVFISPSHEEGWGIVLCEAMACGLPIVCYNLPAFEIFKEGLTRVNLGDKTSFAMEIIRLLQNSFVRRELAKGARVEAQKFGWDKAADREWHYLSKLLLDSTFNL